MKLNRYGFSNTIGLLFLVTLVLLIISLIFGLWAYSGRQNYKNNSNQLIRSAVQKAEVAQQAADKNSFQLEQDNTLTTYVGPSAYGSVKVEYPKSWSAYINTSGSSNSGGTPVDAYFMPDYLTTVTDDGTTDFALRVQIESSSYSEILQQYDQTSGIKVSPYALPKVPTVVGVEITGQIQNNINGTLIVLPLRSQALEIWTEGTDYLNVFNSIILPNLSFSP